MWGFPGGSDRKNSACKVGDPGWEDPLDEGRATPSSIIAWRIPMDRGAWRATVHGVTKSQTRLSDLAHTHVVVAEDTDNEGSYPCEWAGVYGKSTNLLLHFAVNLTTLIFLSLKISLWLFKLLSETFYFVICFKCPCNCCWRVLRQLFKILMILISVSFKFWHLLVFFSFNFQFSYFWQEGKGKLKWSHSVISDSLRPQGL